MDPVIAELQARQAVKRFNQLSGQVKSFTAHANMLRTSKAFGKDPRLLLSEADNLLRSLIASRAEFQKVHVSGFLSKRPPPGGGMAPAAKWGPEFKAGTKQFALALHEAEKAIQLLYKDANTKINLPTRTSTNEDGWFEALLSICEAIAVLVEYCKRSKK